MDALSHQIMEYLDSSQQGSKPALKNLCHLVVLLERYYEHKVKRLDDSLLLHMLSHLAENHIESNSYDMNKSEYLDKKQYIERLEFTALKTEKSRSSAFARCVYFAESQLKSFNEKPKEPVSANKTPTSEIGIDTEVNKILINYPHF